jgi:hypothetical protein
MQAVPLSTFRQHWHRVCKAWQLALVSILALGHAIAHVRQACATALVLRTHCVWRTGVMHMHPARVAVAQRLHGRHMLRPHCTCLISRSRGMQPKRLGAVV